MYKTLTNKEKIGLIKRVKSGEKITKLCKEKSVSRTILYKWIKIYENAGPRSKSKSLCLKTKSGSAHWKKLDTKTGRRVINLALKNPNSSIKNISKKSNVSVGGVWNILLKHNLNTPEKRNKYVLKNGSAVIKERTKEEKLEILNKIEQGQKITQVCKDHGISRTILYKWLKSYKKHGVGALENFKAKGEKHWRYIPNTDELVLNVVISHPEYTPEKISKALVLERGERLIGSTKIYYVLKSLNLNDYQKRLAYVRSVLTRQLQSEQVKSADWEAPVVRKFSFISFIPPPFAEDVLLFIRTYALRIIPPAFISSIFFFIAKSVFNNSFSIGSVFSLISLIFGMFFFLYSLKYYLTIGMVLSFSRRTTGETSGEGGSFIDRIFGREPDQHLKSGEYRNYRGGGGLQPDLGDVYLDRRPFVSIHLATYNEKRVVDRLLTAACSMEYDNYEVIVADDSTDETIDLLRKWENHPRVKILHRQSREGYKGGALKEALKQTDPRAEFIIIFDADFIPYPDTITQFLKYFQSLSGTLDKDKFTKTNIAAIQGYQWHVLNKSENWVTRGVRSEYSGSYVVERSGVEIYSGLKQIAGSVYMIRRDILQGIGWGTSITEDFELTLRLYEKGYKVVYTPYIQAPAEAVSTIRRLIRQRMRWAEGHSHNIKLMFKKLLFSNNLTLPEKFELIYLSPYYLQSFFFILGTLSWFIAETVFRTRLPFWTEVWGWSLVATNLFALPLMNLVGLFLEESEEKDYLGLYAFFVLSYILAPFQGYASLKGFLEKEEGPWFRTPKTGRITDIFTPGRFYRYIFGIFGRPAVAPAINSLAFNSSIAQAGLQNYQLDQESQENEQRSLSPYLALATANNRFNNFKILPRKSRWFGKVFLTITLVVSILTITSASVMPFGRSDGGLINTIVSKLNGSPELIADKNNFSYNDKPTFILKLGNIENSQANKNKGSILGVKPVYAAENSVKTYIYYQGKKLAVDSKVQEENGDYKIQLGFNNTFKPGKYILDVQVSLDGNTYQAKKDFRWGVLVMNTEKSVYKPGEKIKIGLGVLDDAGRTICDADLSMTISVPSEDRDYQLSTYNGYIKRSPTCNADSITNNPDYYAEFDSKYQDETYDVTLQEEVGDQNYIIKDKIIIKKNIPFDIARTYPTRIYPPGLYPVAINIIPSQDFQGTITDKFPSDFIIKDISDNGNLEELNTENKTGPVDSITWNVDWEKGKNYKLKYTVRFPDISPQLYLVGPLEVKNKQTGKVIYYEQRQWQIASDATSYVQSNLFSAVTTVSSQAVTFNSSPTSGNLVVVAISLWNGASGLSVSNVTDNQASTNTYHKIQEQYIVNKGNFQSLWYADNINAGNPSTFTVTVTPSANANITVAIHEYTSIASSPLDQFTQGKYSGAGGTAADSGATAATAQANELLFGSSSINDSSSVAVTPGANYTRRQDQNDNSNSESIHTEDQNVSATGAYHATWTYASSVKWGAQIATFKATIAPENPLLLLILAPFLFSGLFYLKKKKSSGLKRLSVKQFNTEKMFVQAKSLNKGREV